LDFVGQPQSPVLPPNDQGMLGSVAIDGSPSGCQNVNIGETVFPNVFDTLGESFTVEAWIRHPNPADGAYKPFLTRHPGQNLGNEASEFTFQIQRDGNINFFTGCGNYWQYGYQIGLSSPQYPLWKSYTIPPNTWTHVAATVDWRSDTDNFGIVTLYVNGSLVDQKPWGSNDQLGVCTGRKRSRAPGQPVRIGYYDNSDYGVQTYGGEIDEVRIWNSVRTQMEIQQHMHGLFFNKSTLVAYFGFSEAGEALFPTQNPKNLNHTFNQGLSQFPCASGMYDVAAGTFSALPWSRSGLKIHNAPIVTTLQQGSASGQLFGIDLTTAITNPTTFDFWITGMLFATDATAFYSNNGVRTQILPPFPIHIPTLQQIEYLPGTRGGIDVILYKARSRLTGMWEANYAPGTNSTTDCCHGQTKMTFLVRCPADAPADRCGVCGGKNLTLCPCFCDQQGSTQNECGLCGTSGPDCRGCDCIPFSGTRPDCCGICGGPNVNSSTIVDCPNDLCSATLPNCPRVDACGVCGGNNASCSCTSFGGSSTERMDYVLLTSSLNAILAELATVRAGIAAIDAALPLPATTSSNLALAQEIIQANGFCPSSGALSAQLAALLAQLNSYAGGPCGPVPGVVCTPADVFF
jgi:hypothetical protein